MKNGPYELVIAPTNYPGKKYRNRYVYEHQLVWWQNTGQLVPDTHLIHHKNEQKRDNRFENFELKKRAIHTAEHAKPVPMITLACRYCEQEYTIPIRYYKTRLKNTLSGKLFCSQSCGMKDSIKTGKLILGRRKGSAGVC